MLLDPSKVRGKEMSRWKHNNTLKLTDGKKS